MKFGIEELCGATGGELVGGVPAVLSASIDGAGIDSRQLHPGQLFVAVRAARDGHEFIEDAARSGAAAALVDHQVDADLAQIIVPDTVVALGQLGGVARSRLSGSVIGITGSVGKTTTKDLLAAICAAAGPSTASAKSLNNEMGVPLTLVNADPASERTVIEMGARGRGHIALLCAIARPNIAIVTTVASAHTEMFGSVEQIAVAKGELVEALPSSGTAVLNADVALVAAMASRCAGSVLTFGDQGDVRASEVVLDSELRPRFKLHSPWGDVDVALAVRGAHNVGNALAAAGAALASGCSLDHVAAGLASASMSPSRMDLRRTAAGGLVLNDAYNANPSSMRAALTALRDLDVLHRTAVLGVMAELGVDAPDEHRRIADLASDFGISLIAVGTTLYGVDPLPDVDAAIRSVDAPGAGVATLLKGSRVAQLDRLADAWFREDQPPR